jgi:hypothetical protein
MAFTELVILILKIDPGTKATFTTEIAPFLIRILNIYPTPPKSKHFGKILLENGNDVSGDFRLSVGLGSLFLPSSFPFSYCYHLRPRPTALPFPPYSAHANLNIV